MLGGRGGFGLIDWNQRGQEVDLFSKRLEGAD